MDHCPEYFSLYLDHTQFIFNKKEKKRSTPPHNITNIWIKCPHQKEQSVSVVSQWTFSSVSHGDYSL